MSEIEVIKAELAIANDRAKKAEERAQVLFKEADFFMRACDAQKARAEKAEQALRDFADAEHWPDTVNRFARAALEAKP